MSRPPPGPGMDPPIIDNVTFDQNPVSLSDSNPVQIVNVTAMVLFADAVFFNGFEMINVGPDTWNYSVEVNVANYPTPGNYPEVYNIHAIGAGGDANTDETLTVTREAEQSTEYTTVDTTNVNSISLTANLNTNVIEDSGYYGLQGGGFDITRGGEFNVSYNLPTGTIDLPIGEFPTILPDGSFGSSFDPVISISVDNGGNLTSNITINGSNVTATLTENPLQAQEVIWNTENRASTITPSSDDILSSTVTANDVANHYSNQLQTITNAYTYNVLQYWNFDITPIQPDANSIVNNYAAANNRNASNMFLNGEHIVLETTYPYSVKVMDMQNVEQTIVGETMIYAIVYHDDAAPPLQ